jgi:hypothetical protein
VIERLTPPAPAEREAEIAASDPAFAEAAAVSEWSDAHAVDRLSRR